MFSFKPESRSIPIAKIVGGPLDGVRIWQLEEDKDAPLADNCLRCECGKRFSTVGGSSKHRERGCKYTRKIEKLLDEGVIPDTPFSDVTLLEGDFQVLPYQVSLEDGTPCFTQRVYVAGQSGCGKSRWAGNWLREYCHRYPDKQIVAICHTPIAEDIAYQGIEADQLELSDPEFAELCREEVLAGGLIQDQICLFDDIDKLEGEARETANRLLGQTIMMGRKQGIPVCFCNHLGADRSATRDILNGATAVVVFPRGGSPGQLEYLLKKHVGLSAAGYRAILGSRPRWTYVHRNYPSYVMTEKRLCSMEELDRVQKESEKPYKGSLSEMFGIVPNEKAYAATRRKEERTARGIPKRRSGQKRRWTPATEVEPEPEEGFHELD